MEALIQSIAQTHWRLASVRLTAIIFSALFAAVLFVFALLVLHSCEACYSGLPTTCMLHMTCCQPYLLVLVLFAFALGGLLVLPLPLFILHMRACDISILAAAAVCMQHQASTSLSQKWQKTPLCIADELLAYVARTRSHRPAQAIIYTTRLSTAPFQWSAHSISHCDISA